MVRLTQHPGYLGCQDTYYVGNFKGIGEVYSQVFIDSYSRVADANYILIRPLLLLLICLMIACYHGMRAKGYQYFVFLTDRGSEYKGNIEHHAFELFLSIEGIEAYYN